MMPQAVLDCMSPLLKLELQAERIAVDSAQGMPVVRLGLITTLYFRKGHT